MFARLHLVPAERGEGQGADPSADIRALARMLSKAARHGDEKECRSVSKMVSVRLARLSQLNIEESAAGDLAPGDIRHHYGLQSLGAAKIVGVLLGRTGRALETAELASLTGLEESSIRIYLSELRRALNGRGLGFLLIGDARAGHGLDPRFAELARLYDCASPAKTSPRRSSFAESMLRRDLCLNTVGEARLLATLLRNPGAAIPVGQLGAEIGCKISSIKIMVSRLRKSLRQFELDQAIVTGRRRGEKQPGCYSFAEAAITDLLQYTSAGLGNELKDWCAAAR